MHEMSVLTVFPAFAMAHPLLDFKLCEKVPLVWFTTVAQSSAHQYLSGVCEIFSKYLLTVWPPKVTTVQGT